VDKLTHSLKQESNEMNLCAKCLETSTETPATHFAKVVSVFVTLPKAHMAQWIPVENEGAHLCQTCLDSSRQITNIKLTSWALDEVE